ncbi:MAG: pyruvoyl-dependent arginine decarboxylase [Candidatus Altiarchaeota archaeon]|nr:pyruvoyl-dependent arginine decarboxylase [Candidatus Altiarchaeota archaeon]
MLLRRFFVVSGKGVSKNSGLMAFDRALHDAGVSQCNLVCVSSILPAGAKMIKPVEITPGSVTFTVLSREDGRGGEDITAGIGWVFCSRGGKDSYGLVVEDHGNKNAEECKRDIGRKLAEMADAREMTVAAFDTKIATLSGIPKNGYGCVVAALVYVE